MENNFAGWIQTATFISSNDLNIGIEKNFRLSLILFIIVSNNKFYWLILQLLLVLLWYFIVPLKDIDMAAAINIDFNVYSSIKFRLIDWLIGLLVIIFIVIISGWLKAKFFWFWQQLLFGLVWPVFIALSTNQWSDIDLGKSWYFIGFVKSFVLYTLLSFAMCFAVFIWPFNIFYI